MADEIIQKYADMFNLQVVAETFFNGVNTSSSTGLDILKGKLILGNFNNSKLPTTLIDSLFVGDNPRYQLVASIDLTLNANHTIFLGERSV